MYHIVVWNMSHAKHFAHMLRVAPKSDVAVLLSCYGLTVVFDMVVAVTASMILAAVLFMRRMVAGVQPQPFALLQKASVQEAPDRLWFLPSLADALAAAKAHVAAAVPAARGFGRLAPR